MEYVYIYIVFIVGPHYSLSSVLGILRILSAFALRTAEKVLETDTSFRSTLAILEWINVHCTSCTRREYY